MTLMTMTMTINDLFTMTLMTFLMTFLMTLIPFTPYEKPDRNGPGSSQGDAYVECDC